VERHYARSARRKGIIGSKFFPSGMIILTRLNGFTSLALAIDKVLAYFPYCSHAHVWDVKALSLG